MLVRSSRSLWLIRILRTPGMAVTGAGRSERTETGRSEGLALCTTARRPHSEDSVDVVRKGKGPEISLGLPHFVFMSVCLSSRPPARSSGDSPSSLHAIPCAGPASRLALFLSHDARRTTHDSRTHAARMGPAVGRTSSNKPRNGALSAWCGVVWQGQATSGKQARGWQGKRGKRGYCE